jgi:LysR family transcriptional regulator, glycine cleavage system transcriptional activator
MQKPSPVIAMSRQRPLTLAGLRGFEAAARHLSLTKAAAELNLTQSAVSRQVQGLEEELGLQLFARKAREIALTPTGAEWLPQVQSMLNELDQGVERLRRAATSPRVAISTFASFASLWLIPRLGRFREAHPNVDLDIGATDRLVDLDAEGRDIAIRYMRHEAIADDAELLFEEVLFPLVSPNYLKTAKRLACLEDLAQHTLIDGKAGGPAEVRATWPAFFGSLARPNIKGRGEMRFDFIAQTFMAAERGQGVALARTYGADLYMNGELVRPFDVSVSTGAGCYLVVSSRHAQRPETRAFLDWLRREVATFNRELSAWLARSGAEPVKSATSEAAPATSAGAVSGRVERNKREAGVKLR